MCSQGVEKFERKRRQHYEEKCRQWMEHQLHPTTTASFNCVHHSGHSCVSRRGHLRLLPIDFFTRHHYHQHHFCWMDIILRPRGIASCCNRVQVVGAKYAPVSKFHDVQSILVLQTISRGPLKTGIRVMSITPFLDKLG